MGVFATRLKVERRCTSRIVKAASGVLAAALLSTVAQATVIVSGSTVTAVSGGSPGAYTLTYNVYNGQDQNGELDGISLIDIPELDLGDLVFINLPTGWYANEYANGPFAVTNPKAANSSPYYIELSADSDETLGIEYGTTVSFVAQVPTPNTVNATFALTHNSFAYDSYTESVDPPIPGPISTTTVPEPSTTAIAGLGLFALAAARRRSVRREPTRW